jgi:hypothetical protein
MEPIMRTDVLLLLLDVDGAAVFLGRRRRLVTNALFAMWDVDKGVKAVTEDRRETSAIADDSMSDVVQRLKRTRLLLVLPLVLLLAIRLV